MLKSSGVAARVVSMPCMEIFDAQPQKYRDNVLPPSVRCRVAVEAASSQPWFKYIGLDGEAICIDEFGMSGKPEQLFNMYGFTADNVTARVLKILKEGKKR